MHEFKNFIKRDGGEFTTQAVEAYVSYLLQRAVKRTANGYLTVIKSFGRWYSENYNVENPAAKVRLLREDPPKQRVVTLDEYRKILAVAKGQDLEIIQFLGNTGLRRDEFRFLKWGNIDRDLRFIRFTGKGRKQRVVPLNNVCKAIVAQYKRGTDKEYFLLNRVYWGREGTYYLCKNLAKQAGIPRFGPHALRHFFATRLLVKGVNIYKVSKILGHASVKTTEKIYAHLVPSDLLGLTDCLAE